MRRLWYDARVRAALLQVAAIGLFAALVAWLAGNTATNLAQRGIAVGFDFLGRAARFPISESLIAYEPTDTFARAILVGLGNTLFVGGLVIGAATVLGLVVGLARRSRHPLGSGLATVFVDVMRNTPLVVQLLFWYALVTIGLPNARQALNPLPGVFLSLRGVVIPSPQIEGSAVLLGLSLLVVLLAVGIGAWFARRHRMRTGHGPRGRWLLTALVPVLLAMIWWWVGLSVTLDLPRLQGFNFVGGLTLTPELFTLLVGLTLYSSAFVGEIIRGGIDAVGQGQWEAGRSLGLSDAKTLRLIVLPQALRVIIPPLTSQYFNIIKNTTLALVVGYPDISYVIATTINQTGQAIEGVAILMGLFLGVSLAISLLMNWYNRRIALVTR
ncbi:MAG TPA: ABC transporter permease subunit [Microvirga sp.]|jgi:general L-amino acid transport system permease protein|nr:ABC transporter permease subunit [Microvirga sp.]